MRPGQRARVCGAWAFLGDPGRRGSVPAYYQTAIELYISKGEELEALARAEEMKAFLARSVIAAPTRFSVCIVSGGIGPNAKGPGIIPQARGG